MDLELFGRAPVMIVKLNMLIVLEYEGDMKSFRPNREDG